MIERAHNTTEHFGVQRVMGFLQEQYWWKGMEEDVKRAIQRCQPCARAQAGFRDLKWSYHHCQPGEQGIDGGATTTSGGRATFGTRWGRSQSGIQGAPKVTQAPVDDRRQVLQEVMPLTIAQHRDKIRFLKVWGGRWDRPKPRISGGGFVLVKRPVKGALDIKTHPQVLKVVQFRESGVVFLQGKNGVPVPKSQECGTVSIANQGYGWVQLERYHKNNSVFSREGEGGEQEEAFLICDKCQKGYLQCCLTPRLERVRVEEWLCTEHYKN